MKTNHIFGSWLPTLVAACFVLLGCQEQPSPVGDASTAGQANSAERTAAEIGKPKPPKRLGVYYSWPSVANGANGNVTTATNAFLPFDLVVLGDKLWQTDHPDYAKSRQIIANLKSRKASIRIFGYINLGVTNGNLSEVQLRQYVDGWKAMGATDIFADCFGTDYGVYRTRQNLLVDYVHRRGMGVMANAWSVNDALGGTDCHLDKRDYYLLESFLVGNGQFRSLAEFKSRGDLAYFYMKQRQVGIAALATTTATLINANSHTTPQFLQSWYGTAMYNFDAYQFTDFNYSASNNLLFAFNNPITSYGTSWKHVDWVEQVNTSLYRRSTNTHTLYVTGNGTSTGNGYFTKP